MPLVEIADVRWFPTKREAEQYVKVRLDKVWRYWSLIEPAGFHRKSGWQVKIYKPVQPVQRQG